ncbi:MAG: hypothetical protein OEO23_15760, partial [Gemmatimonadota bacterium]|nr:hypothetical protein [Gemmatimonadota bacterium]
CLSTGVEVLVRVTPAGDTLVAPGWISLSETQGTLVMAGDYLARNGGTGTIPSEVEIDGVGYRSAGGDVAVDCDGLTVWRFVAGVPAFIGPDAGPEPRRIYLPVRPGTWRVYERPAGNG